MTYTLPLENLTWPDFRILVAPKWGATNAPDSSYVAGGTNSALPQSATSGAAWQVLPYKQRGINKPGFWVKSFERVCLPYVGRAEIVYDYGDLDDAAVPSPSPLALDTTWEVRIQVSARDANSWATVYWGTVDYTEDAGDPGAVIPRGRKVFHCVDGLYRMKRWTLDRHGAHTVSGYGVAQLNDVFGHPGYNYETGRDAPLLGNRYTSSTSYTNAGGVSVWYHQPAGSTKSTDSAIAQSLWTDQQAVEHAIGANKPIGEPCFALQGATYLLAGKNPWPIGEGEAVHDFVCKVLRRERGRGVAYVDWTESDPSGALTVFISVQPQLAADVQYNDPTNNGVVVMSGATSRGNAVTVDLIGDHRCVAEAFRLGDPEQFRVDYLETHGERIELLATLSVLDGKVTSATNQWDGVSLARGWTGAQQTAFIGLPTNSAQAKEEDRYNPVFQLFKFNPSWNGLLSDGDGGASVSLHRADYRCDANGNIITPITAATNKDTDPIDSAPLSNLLIEVLPDTPLIEGYAYLNNTPQRWDSSTSTPADSAETDRQPRRRMTGYIRVAANRYLQFDDPGTALSIQIGLDAQGIWLRHSNDESAGTRAFAAPTSSGFNSSGYDYSAVALTVGLRLPSRVRFASGDPTGRRRGKLYHPGSHLWLASPGAIWALDTSTTSSNGYAARRKACLGTVNGTDSTPGILRDDRAGLAALHALAWAWYGTTTTHRTAQWALRDCGFLPSYQAYSGTSIPSNGGSLTTVTYPTIGKVVTTMNANGSTTTLNTPVTRVHYENETGITTWSTEWAELEHVER